MQLKKSVSVFQKLTSASVALLAVNSAASENSDWENWEFEAAGLIYNESERVSAVEGIISAVNEYEQDHFLSYKITLDVLTGASANGAVAQLTPQTFTRPSGNGQYSIDSTTTPLDDTFKDTRVQLNFQWDKPLQENYKLTTGAHLSREFDYTSIGFNGGISKDLWNNNTTISAGVSVSYDIIDPVGKRPLALSSMVIDNGQFATPELFRSAFDLTRQSGTDDKIITDILVGVTQVINRRMLMQLNYSWSNADGYLTDPYKVISVVDGGGISQDYLYESRPDSRTKQSIYWQTKYHFAEAGLFNNVIADVSYRYMQDDWEIDSSTIDFKLLFPLENGDSIEPHVRFYTQQAAEFYRPFLNQSEINLANGIPKFASADYRIGELEGLTLGVKYIYQIDSEHDFTMRLEFYRQTSSDAGFTAVGILQNLDVTPDLDAVFAQLGYSF